MEQKTKQYCDGLGYCLKRTAGQGSKELRKALEGLLAMAECWAVIDGGKNIQLEASDAVAFARRALSERKAPQ